MKKILVWLTAIAMILAFCGCNTSQESLSDTLSAPSDSATTTTITNITQEDEKTTTTNTGRQKTTSTGVGKTTGKLCSGIPRPKTTTYPSTTTRSTNSLTAQDDRLPQVKYSAKDSNAVFRDMVTLSDGGFAICGQRTLDAGSYAIIQLYDKNADFQTERSFSRGEGFVDMATCNDGGILAASSNPPRIIKTNRNLDTQWSVDYEKDGLWGTVRDVQEISPDLITLLFSSRSETGYALYLAYVDKNGNLLETVLLKKVSLEEDYATVDNEIIPDGKGGFYLVTSCNQSLANTYPLVAQSYDSSKAMQTIIMHFSADRKLDRVKIVGNSGNDWPEEATVDGDGNFYIVLGTDNTQKDDFWEMPIIENRPLRRMLVKLDKDGNIVYKAPLSNRGRAVDLTYGIHVNKNTTYVVGMAYYVDGYQNMYPCPQVSPNEYDSVVFVAKLDKNGKELDRKMFRSDINAEPCDSVLLPNGSLVIAGRLFSYDTLFDVKFPTGVDQMEALFVYKE